MSLIHIRGQNLVILLCTVGFALCLFSVAYVTIPLTRALEYGYFSVTPPTFWLGIILEVWVVLYPITKRQVKASILQIFLISVSLNLLPLLNERFPYSGDSYAHLLRANIVSDSGSLIELERTGYYEWPNLFLLVSFLKSVPLLSDFIIAQFFIPMYSTFALILLYYVIFKALTGEKEVALLSTLIGSIAAGYSHVSPSLVGWILLWFILAICLLGKLKNSKTFVALAWISVVALTFSHHFQMFSLVVILTGIFLTKKGLTIHVTQILKYESARKQYSFGPGLGFVLASLFLFVLYNFIVNGFLDPKIIFAEWLHQPAYIKPNPISLSTSPIVLISQVSYHFALGTLGLAGLVLAVRQKKRFVSPLLGWSCIIAVVSLWGQLTGGTSIQPLRTIDLAYPAVYVFGGFSLSSFLITKRTKWKKVVQYAILGLMLVSSLSVTTYVGTYFRRQQATFSDEEYAFAIFGAKSIPEQAAVARIYTDAVMRPWIRYHFYQIGSLIPEPEVMVIVVAEESPFGPPGTYLFLNKPREFSRMKGDLWENLIQVLNTPQYNQIYSAGTNFFAVYQAAL